MAAERGADYSPTKESGDADSYPQEKKVDGQTIATSNDKLSNEGSPEQQWDFSDIDPKKLQRKIDLKIIPWLAVLYLLSFLDRSAIGNARLFGLEQTLGLHGTQYNVAASIFYFSYAVFEVPSNILLKRLTPSKWFGTITVLVGVCMLSQGVTSNYGGLLAARFCLGIAEAGLFPGANVLMAGWYPRHKFGLRAAIFFSAATISGAFGGLLSVGLSKIRAGQYSGPNDGWRWIFIVIGLATFVSGILSFWLVADFPDTAKFLSEKERAYVIAKLQENQQYSAAGEKFTWNSFWKACFDPLTPLALLIYMGIDGPLYAFSVFTPTIVASLGRWNSVQTNLLTVPIYIFACIVTVCVGFLADRRGNRALTQMVLIAIGIAGYIILLAVNPSRHPGVSYFAIYLAAAGIYPCIPNSVALCGSHIEGAYKRGVVIGLFVSYGNIHGAATSQVYLAKEKPTYHTGHGVILAYLAIGWLCTLGYYLTVKAKNRSRERGGCDETYLDHMPYEEAVEAAVRARQQEAADMKAQGGLLSYWRRLQMKIHAQPGGTYANVQEAKRLKGDAWSGHRYSN